MTEQEMIKQMLQMQYDLNQDIMQKKGLTEINKPNLFFAIFDELGELSHELKHEWCWWKEHQAEVDHDKTLEEYVDVVHFALIYEIDVLEHSKKERGSFSLNITKAHQMVEFNANQDKLKVVNDLYTIIIKDTYWHPASLLWNVLELGFTLGFSMEDIYNEYLKKNKVNFERLANGY